jgi:transcription antitermination factor NusG
MTEPYWAIAVAQTNREDFVQSLLKREGFEVYWPKIKTESKRTAGLFPGYLMVRVVVRWYPIRWCPGVIKVLMTGERPSKLADVIVDEIRGREVKGFVRLPKPATLERGQKVRVMRGTFAGRVALYEGMAGPQRERVLLDLLGQSVAVTLPADNIEPLRA